MLVVGMGNSGADIGLEVARTHPTIVSGKEFGHVPVRIETWVANHVVLRIVRFIGHHVLTVRSPIGQQSSPLFLTGGAPLIRVKPKDLVKAGRRTRARVVGVQDGLPVVDGGRVLEVSNVLWCTGFRPGFSWIDLPVHGEHEPRIGAASSHRSRACTSSASSSSTRPPRRRSRA